MWRPSRFNQKLIYKNAPYIRKPSRLSSTIGDNKNFWEASFQVTVQGFSKIEAYIQREAAKRFLTPTSCWRSAFSMTHVWLEDIYFCFDGSAQNPKPNESTQKLHKGVTEIGLKRDLRMLHRSCDQLKKVPKNSALL